MNHATFIGNITADAVKKDFNGKQFTAFSIAVNHKSKDKEYTTFVSCAMSGDTGNLFGYLKRGKKVAVSGRVSARAYVGRDNAAHAELQLSVRDLELCGGNNADVRNEPQPMQPQVNGDNLPF